MIPVDDTLSPRPLSRLSYKIMGLNLIALIILGTGIVYLDKYKRDLTAAETEILATEARLYSSLLADNASSGGGISKKKAEGILTNFVLQKSQRLRLFDDKGELLIDIQGKAEEPFSGNSLPGYLGKLLNNGFADIVDLFSPTFGLPLYPVTESAKSLPDVKDAFAGKVSVSAWRSPTGGLILSTASPIMKEGKDLGVLLVIRSDTMIERTFAAMRVDILKLSLGALVITLVFSLYLSAVIGHPLRQLAGAAEKVRQGAGNQNLIPDLSSRHDEIGELSVALHDMTTALQSRMETIERFAADVAHELKNPLTSIRSAIETLNRVSNQSDKNQLVAIIEHDLLRMDRLISDISLSSRLDTELARDAFETLQLNDVIQSVIYSFDHQDIKIQTSGLDNSYKVFGNPHRLSQVFQNIISNAISFSAQGGIVKVQINEHGKNHIAVTIEDQGPGIPESAKSRIFERFYTQRPEAQGFGNHSGLGLAIAKQIIDAHKGLISVENVFNPQNEIAGARFTIVLEAA